MSARTITKTLGGMWVGSYGLVRCPCHNDRKPSLKIKDDSRKSDGIDLICFAGCDWKDVKAELQRQGLIDLVGKRPQTGRKATATICSPSTTTTEVPAPAPSSVQVRRTLDHTVDDDLKRRVDRALHLWRGRGFYLRGTRSNKKVERLKSGLGCCRSGRDR
jgi:hypothetical protein